MLHRIDVIAIDSDPPNLLTLNSITEDLGVPFQAFRSPLDYWKAKPNLVAACVVANVMAFGDPAEEILTAAVAEGRNWKSLAILSYLQLNQAVRLMQRGITDVLEAPLNAEVIKPQLARAIDEARNHLQEGQEKDSLRAVLNSISHRDAQVLRRICLGTVSRQIAADLDLSLRTVQSVRSRLAKKLGVQGLSGWRRISFQLATMESLDA